MLPTMDIIWVMDESGSSGGITKTFLSSSQNFYSRLLSAGVDFRMGVTNVVRPSNSACAGKFCSKISSNASDDGGTDRFLLPTESNIFASCMKNPPCSEKDQPHSLHNARQAVKRHLPRAANDPSKIRTNATLVVIVVTDKVDHGLKSLGYGAKPCPLPAADQATLDKALQPYLNLFMGITDPEATAMYHLIGNVCGSASTNMNHAHMTLANKLGGQKASIAQKDLSATLQVIIDSVVGCSSNNRLDYVPISSSLAVAVDAVQLKRSRYSGFDYRPERNALVFMSIKYKKGSEVIIAYKRWKAQSQ